jgi:hypothetical protein
MNGGDLLRVEVHAFEKWLSPECAQGLLGGTAYGFEVVPPDFSAETDVFLFYEETVTEPSLYLRAPIEKRFGLLLEPSPISPSVALSLGHATNFRKIFSHDPFLLKTSSVYRKNLFGSSVSFRTDDMAGAPEKNAVISMITSSMSTTAGHRFRLRLAKLLHSHQSGVAIFGRDIPWGPFLPDRRDGVAPFMFSIVVENCRKPNYFSEKLVDCFVTRTVPLYWGCPNIADFYDLRGLLIFNDEKSFWSLFEKIMDDPVAVYESCREGLEENFRRSLNSYNVPIVWRSVAEALASELAVPWSMVEVNWLEQLRLSLLGRVYLIREHCFRIGTTPFVPRRLRRAVGRMLKVQGAYR